ncbi:MAG: hypothetical protein PHP61_00965 [Candidatus Izemoplasmatales bacterium]|mgnify:CR=1 FL=1|jgi:uncharacterized membrane protein YczE|nr:hypothetical protein [Candidatus Izemoplasmatales bacterium]MDD4354453.1 hypothetical protein [Candidatus Izemoplasmatales bacterium]MDD4988069.1 hypothetical protein [Candidatus Izemoplasmatales bacterium]MDD5601438.1 hypothetical protein [Candidatus Izemoplasmatales bacterium]
MAKFSWKKLAIYMVGLTLLGLSVALMQQTRLGMSSWDALNRNFYEGIPIDYKYLNPIVALILVVVAYLLQHKRFSLWMLFPLAISFYVGLVIDLLLLIIPLVVNSHWLFNALYLALAIVICAIGLNLVIYGQFPLPALDELCLAIANRLHTTFGKGKLIGELIALVATVVFGLVFHHQEHWFYLGPTTIIFTFSIGFVVDLLNRPIHSILGEKHEN